MRNAIITALCCVLFAASVPARADVTADALLKVLVRKGVLTQQEADEVKAEAQRESATGTPAKESPAPVVKAPGATLNGYIQFRTTNTKRGRPSSQFADRRARITVRHNTPTGRAVVAIDGAPSAVALMDGYYDWYLGREKGKEQRTFLRLGQFMKPFSLEFERSPADYEFHELPAGWTALFPGYRDVGGFVSHMVNPETRVDFGIVNGNGAGSISLPNRDNDNAKDVMARILYRPAKVGEFDLSVYRGRNTVSGYTGDRNRLGLGTALPNVLGGEPRAEYIAAEDVTGNLGSGPSYATADAKAWYAMYLLGVAPKTQLALRYDEWDPDTRDEYRLGGDGEVRTYGIVGVRNVTESLKLSVSWERPRKTMYDSVSGTSSRRNDDVLTFQGQYRF